MIQGYVSIKSLLAKIYRDTGINDEFPVDDIIEWCVESLLFIGAFSQFDTKPASLKVEGYKTKLPCDFYKLIDISNAGRINPTTLTQGNFWGGAPMFYSGQNLNSNYFCTGCQIPFQTSQNVGVETFTINDTFIHTSFEEGYICINYLAMHVDEDGMPMIPDDVYFTRACVSYVIYMLDWQEWRKGRIADKVYKDSEAKWDWNCGAARGAANMPDASQTERLKNVLQRLTPLQSEYLSQFRNTGTPERRKLH